MITSNWCLDPPELAWRSNRQMRTNLMPPRAVLCRLASVQRGRQMTLEEIHKRILLRADLGQDDMIVAGLDVAIDRLKMALWRRSAGYLLSYSRWRHVLARSRETLGVRQLRHDRPAREGPAEIMMGGPARLFFPIRVTHRHFRI